MAVDTHTAQEQQVLRAAYGYPACRADGTDDIVAYMAARGGRVSGN